MAIFFSLLATAINKHPTIEVQKPTVVNFTRLIHDTPVVPTRHKPVRPTPPPPISVQPPSVTRTGPGEVVTTPVRPTVEPGPIATSRGIDHDPIPSVRVNPIYPPHLQTAGIEGWVKVQFDIAASGAVTNVAVVDAQPKGSFDAAATSAVARWKYDPMVRDGRPVERRGVQVVLRFSLDD